jgi:2-beta-glucuronyltransferase
MSKVLIFSDHYFLSKNKAGFHFIAEELAIQGNHVNFVTTRYSLLNVNKFIQSGGRIRDVNQVIPVANNINMFILFTILPMISYRNKVINKIIEPVLVAQYKLAISLFIDQLIKNADIIVFESCSFLRMFDYLQNINSTARYIYRVSDLLSLLKNPDWLLQYEKKIINSFDLVSVPSSYMYKFYTKNMAAVRVKLTRHGLNKNVFDLNADENPYDEKCVNLVWVGISYFDEMFLKMAAIAFPNFYFHIIGNVTKIKLKNVISYGKLPFSDTIKYIKYANSGLANRIYSPGTESLSDSLKIQQYTYCKLPIIAPSFMNHYQGNNMIYYTPNDLSSIINCVNLAIDFSHDIVDNSMNRSWSEVVTDIFKI